MERPPAKNENAPDLRQQNKIIKIVESGNLDVLNQPLAAVSADERDSFIGKMRGGQITEDTLDSGVIRHIGAPFSGQNGIPTLRDQLQNNQRLQRDFSGALRDSLYKGARYQEGQPLSPDDLARFVQMYPTPHAFDKAFVGDRMQQLQTAYESEQSSGRKDALKAEMTLQRQKENEIYPRLRTTLYGKRNEYWEQSKMLLREARGGATDAAVEARPTTPEASIRPEPRIEQPPPPRQQERPIAPETSEFLRNHVVERDLSYQDAALPEEVKQRTLDWSRKSESATKYADSIMQLSNRQNLESIRETARGLVQTMAAEAARLGIPVSPYGRSNSWAMWDIGKQNYFFTHQEENNPEYEIGDPLTSDAKREEIINRHLGWEAYAAYRSNAAAEWKQRVSNDPRFTSALELLNKPPKQNGSLGSKDLAELGKRLRQG